MRLFRMVLGVAVFAASSWASPYLADIAGIPTGLSFLTVGGILSFLGGALFYSGVVRRTSSCRS